MRANAHACVSTPETINYIHMVLNLYINLIKFAVFQNGHGLSNEACHKRNQFNKTIVVL